MPHIAARLQGSRLMHTPCPRGGSPQEFVRNFMDCYPCYTCAQHAMVTRPDTRRTRKLVTSAGPPQQTDEHTLQSILDQHFQVPVPDPVLKGPLLLHRALIAGKIGDLTLRVRDLLTGFDLTDPSKFKRLISTLSVLRLSNLKPRADMTLPHQTPRVCVIGAGISGVVAAAHLHAAGVAVTVFERNKVAGGVWLYDERSPPEPVYPSVKPSEGDWFDEDGEASGAIEDELELRLAPPGPSYAGLRNNVSTRLLELQLGPWNPGTPEFVNHQVLKEYIQDSTRRSGIESLLVYGTRVTRVWKEAVWHVETASLKKQGQNAEGRRIERKEWVFDNVVVCSGHYHACRIPNIPGLRDWKARWPDRVQHSKSYRRPDGFKDQKVLLIGAGVSSTDIARELGPFAKQIYQSSRGGDFDLPATLLPPNGVRIGGISSFDTPSLETNLEASTSSSSFPYTVTLTSGRKLCDIDRIIICTGYHISYPFLHSFHRDDVPADAADSRVLVTDGTQVHNLHKDIFYMPDPSLAFVGVPYYTATFSLFEFQALAVAAVVSGRVQLPAQKQMRSQYLAKVLRKGSGRHFNSLKGEEAQYVADLVAWINSDAARLGGPALFVEGHTEAWHRAKTEQMERMKSMRFGVKIGDSGERDVGLTTGCL